MAREDAPSDLLAWARRRIGETALQLALTNSTVVEHAVLNRTLRFHVSGTDRPAKLQSELKLTAAHYDLTSLVADASAPERPSLLDIGGNVGAAAILAHVLSGACVVTLEPVPTTFFFLRWNLRENAVPELLHGAHDAGADRGRACGVRPLNLALTHDGQRTVRLSMGARSMNAHEADGAISYAEGDDAASPHGSSTFEVASTSVGQLLARHGRLLLGRTGRVSLLKVDCEGLGAGAAHPVHRSQWLARTVGAQPCARASGTAVRPPRVCAAAQAASTISRGSCSAARPLAGAARRRWPIASPRCGHVGMCMLGMGMLACGHVHHAAVACGQVGMRACGHAGMCILSPMRMACACRSLPPKVVGELHGCGWMQPGVAMLTSWYHQARAPTAGPANATTARRRATCLPGRRGCHHQPVYMGDDRACHALARTFLARTSLPAGSGHGFRACRCGANLTRPGTCLPWDASTWGRRRGASPWVYDRRPLAPCAHFCMC